MKVKLLFQNLLSKWYILLIVVAVSFTASNYYCRFINMPRNEETISIFMATYSSDLSHVHEYLNSKNDEYNYLREINITSISKDDEQFDYFFALKGLNVSDIFILPESVLNKTNSNGVLKDQLFGVQFVQLDKTYLNTYSNFVYDESGYGILLHENGDTNNALNFYRDVEKDENYYIFFRLNSLHIGKLNNTDFDAAFNISKALIEYGKN